MEATVAALVMNSDFYFVRREVGSTTAKLESEFV